jgi:succinylarginine dihydrolase
MAASDLVQELQIDGLPGPTHHFAGLGVGNKASQQHAGFISRPRAAARQGLAKMRRIMQLGVPQAFLPPLPRPDFGFLRRSGLSGSERELVAAATSQQLHIAYSSAFMWTANCATVAPASDTDDGRSRLVVANMSSTKHRALEGAARAEQLRAMLPVDVVAPLTADFADEGAANHIRLTGDGHGEPGLHLFVYGRDDGLPAAALPKNFPARQNRLASDEVARLLRIPPARALFARQHPAAIDAGAFHNDVVMASNRNHLLLHEHALVDQAAVITQMRRRLPSARVAEISAQDLTLDEAVSTYLFNSQLLDTADGMLLLAPEQARAGKAGAVIARLLNDGFIAKAEFIDLRESMANGGGPACLRLRMPLSVEALKSAGNLLTEVRLRRLEQWVDRHYRVELRAEDLADPALIDENRNALDELAQLA